MAALGTGFQYVGLEEEEDVEENYTLIWSRPRTSGT